MCVCEIESNNTWKKLGVSGKLMRLIFFIFFLAGKADEIDGTKYPIAGHNLTPDS